MIDIESLRIVISAITQPALYADKGKILCMNDSASSLFSALPGEDMYQKLPKDIRMLVESINDGNAAITGQMINGVMMHASITVLDEGALITFARQRSKEDSAMMAEVGRQIRLPLNLMISAYTVLISQLGELQDERSQEYMSIINRAYYNMLRISDNLVFLGDINNEAVLLCATNVDIDDFCMDIVKRVSPLAELVDVSIRFEGGTKGEIIALDRIKAERMLLHLLSNALEHSKPGGEIALKAGKTGDQVVLTVHDDGDGKKDEENDEFYFAGDESNWNSARKGIGSLGIGLSIVRAIAELHGGSFVMTKCEGGGVSASVSLPATMAYDSFGDIIDSTTFPIELVELSGILPSSAYSMKRLD